MEIRTGKLADVSSITDIFNYYIEHSNARFEESPLSLDNRLEWFSQFKPDSRHQIYVAIDSGKLIGFACSQPYRAMAAFDETVEVTVYLAPFIQGKGVGSKLYEKLFWRHPSSWCSSGFIRCRLAE